MRINKVRNKNQSTNQEPIKMHACQTLKEQMNDFHCLKCRVDAADNMAQTERPQRSNTHERLTKDH